MPQHEYIYNATIEVDVSAHFTQEKFEDFREEGETVEEFARRQALAVAPRRLTNRISDNGVDREDINLGELKHQEVWEYEAE